MEFPMQFLLLLFLLMPFCGEITQAQPKAPTTDEVCATLRPGDTTNHKPSNESNFKLVVDPLSLLTTSQVTIRLESQENTFLGFVIGVRLVAEIEKNGALLRGEFMEVVKDPPEQAYPIEIKECPNKRGEYVRNHFAHFEPTLSTEVKWMPPDVNGIYQVRAAVIENSAITWVDFTSEPINVTREEPPASTTVEPSKCYVDPLVYSNCGKTTGCFALPNNCIKGKDDCQVVIEFSLDQNVLVLRLTSILPYGTGYVAMGLSNDVAMSEDFAFACFRDPDQPDKVRIGLLFTQKATSISMKRAEQLPYPLNKSSQYIVPEATKFEGCVISCSFKFTAKTVKIFSPSAQDPSDIIVFDLITGKFHILAASGDVFLQQHNNVRHGVSSVEVNLGDVVILGKLKDKYTALHGVFMTLAWIVCAPASLLYTRFFRQNLLEVQVPVLKLPFWFSVHTSMGVLTFLFTVIGCFFIFAKHQQFLYYAELPFWPDQVHPVIGIAVMVGTTLQTLAGFFRPGDTAGALRRNVFKWSHWIIGSVTMSLAWVSVHSAILMPYPGLDQWAYWGMQVVFLNIHGMAYFFLMITTSYYDGVMAAKQRISIDALRAFRPGCIKHSGTMGEIEGFGPKIGILFVDVVTCLVTAISIITVIVESYNT